MDNPAAGLEEIAIGLWSFRLPYFVFLSHALASIVRVPLETCNYLLGVLNIHLNQYTDKDWAAWLSLLNFLIWNSHRVHERTG